MSALSFRSHRVRACAAAGLLSLPALALAHVGAGSTHGFYAGLQHPLSGADHLCAMVAVGAWAGWLGRRFVWLLPATFLALMAAGGAWGVAQLPVPGGQLLIAVSVIVLGLLLACEVRPPKALAMLAVGLFAFAHGHAHGVEMPQDASGLAYGMGFVLAAGLLHGVGLLIGRWLATRSTFLVRLAGGSVAVGGLALIAFG